MENFAKGQITYLMLSCLLERDYYAFDIIASVAERSEGKIQLKKPSVYSSLTRMEKQGLVSSYSGASDIGPSRRYYTITESGRQAHAALKKELDEAEADRLGSLAEETHTSDAEIAQNESSFDEVNAQEQPSTQDFFVENVNTETPTETAEDFSEDFSSESTLKEETEKVVENYSEEAFSPIEQTALEDRLEKVDKVETQQTHETSDENDNLQETFAPFEDETNPPAQGETPDSEFSSLKDEDANPDYKPEEETPQDSQDSDDYFDLSSFDDQSAEITAEKPAQNEPVQEPEEAQIENTEEVQIETQIAEETQNEVYFENAEEIIEPEAQSTDTETLYTTKQQDITSHIETSEQVAEQTKEETSQQIAEETMQTTFEESTKNEEPASAEETTVMHTSEQTAEETAESEPAQAENKAPAQNEADANKPVMQQPEQEIEQEKLNETAPHSAENISNQQIFDVYEDARRNRRRRSFADDQIGFTKLDSAEDMEQAQTRQKENLEELKRSLLATKNSAAEQDEDYQKFLNYVSRHRAAPQEGSPTPQMQASTQTAQNITPPVQNATQTTSQMHTSMQSSQPQQPASGGSLRAALLAQQNSNSQSQNEASLQKTAASKQDDGFFITEQAPASAPVARKNPPARLKILDNKELSTLPPPNRDINMEPSHKDIISKIYSSSKDSKDGGSGHLYDYDDLGDYYKSVGLSFKVYEKSKTPPKHNTNKLEMFASLASFGIFAVLSIVLFAICAGLGVLNATTSFLYILLPVLGLAELGVRAYQYKFRTSWEPRPMFMQWFVWVLSAVLVVAIVLLNLILGAASAPLADFAATIFLPIFAVIAYIPARFYIKRAIFVRYWK